MHKLFVYFVALILSNINNLHWNSTYMLDLKIKWESKTLQSTVKNSSKPLKKKEIRYNENTISTLFTVK